MYLYINGRCVTQFENCLDSVTEVVAKPIHDLTEDNEIELKNNFIRGTSVCLDTINNVNDEGEEIAEEDADEESDDDEDTEFDFD